MKKIVHLLVQTTKNLFGKEKNCGKLLPLLERPLSWPPCEMNQHAKPNMFKWDWQ
jgi:hypothetical protein